MHQPSIFQLVAAGVELLVEPGVAPTGYRTVLSDGEAQEQGEDCEYATLMAHTDDHAVHSLY